MIMNKRFPKIRQFSLFSPASFPVQTPVRTRCDIHGKDSVQSPGRTLLRKVAGVACMASIFANVPMQVTLAADDARTLTVYTYESFTTEWGPGPAIKQGFEAQCGDCEINFVALDSSAGILNRVQLEGPSSPADVVLGLDTNLMAIAQDTGLLAPSGVDTDGLTLPIDWNSEIFVPFDYGYFAFIHDTEALPEPPASFDELIGSADDLKIIIQDPRTSTPGLGLLLWMKAVYGERAAEKWQALQPRILTVTKGWSEAYFSLFLNGEAPMVLSYSTSPAYHMEIDKTERYQAVAFEEGHYLQVEVAALLEQSERQELGRQFLEYLVSQEAQTSIPLGNVMYPVADLEDDLPQSFQQLITPSRTLQFSPEEVRDQRRAWIDEWLEASTGG